jgi:outer membrane protein OmpA-like peptidoglycan-associated protein
MKYFLIFLFFLLTHIQVRSQSVLTPLEQVDSISNEIENGSWNMSGVLLSKGLVLHLRGLPFAEKGAGFTNQSVPVLDSLANFLRAHPSIHLSVSAHFSSDSPAHLIKQNAAQAKSVAAYLTARKVHSKRLKITKGGTSKPLYPDIILNQLQSQELQASFKQLNSRIDLEIIANLN